MTEESIKPEHSQAQPADNKHRSGDNAPSGSTPVPIEKGAESKAAPKASDQTASGRDGAVRPEAPNWFLYSQTFVGIALVAVTISQCEVGRWQWSATNDQYNAMTKEIELMRLDQRPWVGFLVGGCTAPIKGTPYTLCLDLINYGRTPGGIKKLKTATFVALSIKDLDSHFVQYQSEAKEFDVGSYSAPGVATPIELPDGTDFSDSVEAIDKGERILVVLGYVEYEAGPGKGESQVCYIYDPKNQVFKLHRDHNYMK